MLPFNKAIENILCSIGYEARVSNMPRIDLNNLGRWCYLITCTCGVINRCKTDTPSRKQILKLCWNPRRDACLLVLGSSWRMIRMCFVLSVWGMWALRCVGCKGTGLNDDAPGGRDALGLSLPWELIFFEKLMLPTKPCRLTSSLVGKVFQAVGQAGAAPHTMVVLQAYQADLLKDFSTNGSIDEEAFSELCRDTDLSLWLSRWPSPSAIQWLLWSPWRGTCGWTSWVSRRSPCLAFRLFWPRCQHNCQ